MYRALKMLRNSEGFTFVEAIFQLVIVAIFAHFILLIMLALQQFLTIEQQLDELNYEMFVSELNQFLREAKEFRIANKRMVLVFSEEEPKIEYTIHNTSENNDINLSVTSKGYMPLYTNSFIQQLEQYEKTFFMQIYKAKYGMRERHFVVPIFQ